MYKMGLEHLLVPANKEVFTKANRRTLPKFQNINPAVMASLKGCKKQLKERAPIAKLEDLHKEI